MIPRPDRRADGLPGAQSATAPTPPAAANAAVYGAKARAADAARPPFEGKRQ